MQNVYYSSISCVAMAALLILGHFIRRSDLMAPDNKRYFRLAVWAVVLVMAAEQATIHCAGRPGPYRLAHVLGNVVGFGLSPLLPLLIGSAIGGARERRRRLALLALPAALNLALAVLSAWVPLIFGVDGENGYARGPLFWVYILAYVSGLVYLLAQTLSVTRNFQNTSRAVLVVLFAFVLAGTTCQVLVPWLHLTWLCVAFALVLYYVYFCELLQQVDSLTGLLNRGAYERRLREEREGAAVILFDIDDFKSVNDRHGHPFGDQCLTAVSACIRKVFFRSGLCFRIGGDEFCVVAGDLDPGAVEESFQRFLREIDALRRAEPRLPLVSVGWAFAGEGGLPAAVERADQAMYRFKRRRKEENRR